MAQNDEDILSPHWNFAVVTIKTMMKDFTFHMVVLLYVDIGCDMVLA